MSSDERKALEKKIKIFNQTIFKVHAFIKPEMFGEFFNYLNTHNSFGDYVLNFVNDLIYTDDIELIESVDSTVTEINSKLNEHIEEFLNKKGIKIEDAYGEIGIYT